MTKRLTIALVAVALFVLMAVMPVSAHLTTNGSVINRGAFIFIGEEGLNVTHALNQVVGDPANGVPAYTRIGWWASAADITITPPSKVIDLGIDGRYKYMTVAPADFVGYTGNWYLLDNTGSVIVSNLEAFNVQDPTLDIKIWDYNQNADVTGKSVPQGELLGFRIDTNMYPAVDGNFRNNVIDDDFIGTWGVTPMAGDVWVTNLLFNQSVGWWSNGTMPILTNPGEPCCPVYADVYVERFQNYTSSGAWMTWSAGHYGCFRQNSQVFYWNNSTGWLYDTYPASLAGTPVSTTVTWTGINYCALAQVPSAATDGYINLKVKDEANAQLNALYNASAAETWWKPGPNSVLKNFVSNQPWFWGTSLQTPVHLNADTRPYDGFVWDTDSLDTFNQYSYPVGTYTISAESILNKMKDNYKQGGADYTGKTVSQTYTITLVSDTVKIEANKDSVVRSKSFSVTVTGRPSTSYNLWVKGTSSMSGLYDDQPPMIVLAQEKVRMDTNPWPSPASYPTVTGMYQYENGAGLMIIDDVSVNANTWNGTRCYANITTSTSGTRTIEFLTTNWTKAQKYTIRVEQKFGPNYKSDEVDVKVEKGAVTIVAAGDQSYYLGEEIKLSGTNTETYRTFLFIVGPNLPTVGAQIQNPDPRHWPVVNNVVSTFKYVDVNGDNTWSWKWGTSNYALDAGTYTIYAVSQPYDRDHLAEAAYGTVSIILKKPFVSATASQSTVAKGDRIYITGTAEGDPSNVMIWIMGKNKYIKATESVNSDASFKYEVRQETTKNLASGQYFVVVQHPMQNNRFDINTVDVAGAGLNQLDVVNDLWVYNLQMKKDAELGTYTKIFKLGGAGSLQGSDAAEALVQGINDANVDDTYTKLQFLVEEPVIRIDPIGDKHVGDKFTITAQTNLAVDDEVLVQVYSSSFKPTQKSQSGEFSGATGTVKVTKGDSGMNKISFDVDSSTFKPDEYIVTENAVIQEDATGTALFNVLEQGPATPAPTAVVTAAPTAAPTAVVTTAAPTPVPTTKSPGYGALIALIGLGAVAFIVVRRH